MRLLIDASSLLLRSAGIKSYTYHWLAAMRDSAGADHVDAFPFIGRLGALMHEGSMLSTPATLPRWHRRLGGEAMDVHGRSRVELVVHRFAVTFTHWSFASRERIRGGAINASSAN